jgi:hypothetical protein
VSLATLSLTYDGTTVGQAKHALPALAKNSLLATFYAEPTTLLDGIRDWRKARSAGHEIGNGCLLEAAMPDGSLPSWTLDAVQSDVEEADALFRELFPGQSAFSFAYPQGSPVCVDGASYRPVVERSHAVCRAGTFGLNDPGQTDLTWIKCVDATGRGVSAVMEHVDAAIARRAWLVLVFSEIDDPVGHAELLAAVAVREGLTIATVVEAAARVLGGDPKPARLL